MKSMLINLGLCILTLFIALEIAGYSLFYAMPDLFDNMQSQRAQDLHASDAQSKFDHFMRYNFSPVTGWQEPPWSVLTLKDCLGAPHRATQDGSGDRVYKGYDRSQAQLLLIGDSYTYGDEIGDEDTIAARIYQRTGVVTANLGGRGFDPTQAVLRAQARLKDFPNARMIILGIMYEDMHRLMNSYRGFYYRGMLFGFKPYVENGVIHGLNIGAYRSLADMQKAIEYAQEHDFWAEPAYRFPYSKALIEALTSQQFRIMNIGRKLYHLPSAYEIMYGHTEAAEDLYVLLNYFTHWAQAHHLTYAVVFLPPRGDDTTSPDDWIKIHRSRLPADMVLQNLNFATIDPERYNVSLLRKCHPSPYGANQIASQYITLLQAHGLNLSQLLFGSVYSSVAQRQ